MVFAVSPMSLSMEHEQIHVMPVQVTKRLPGFSLSHCKKNAFM